METQTLTAPYLRNDLTVLSDWSDVIETLSYRERDENNAYLVGITLDGEEYYAPVYSTALINKAFDLNLEDEAPKETRFQTRNAAQIHIINLILNTNGIEIDYN
jgi:hypothetical protein